MSREDIFEVLLNWDNVCFFHGLLIKRELATCLFNTPWYHAFHKRYHLNQLQAVEIVLFQNMDVSYMWVVSYVYDVFSKIRQFLNCIIH